MIASCDGGTPSQTPSGADFPVGGTLRLALVSPGATILDPHAVEANVDATELHRCCLSRTLLSYAGTATEEGGTELRPDLAISMPDVARDGLTWTFRLKPGITYAPPLDEIPITSADFVRSIERLARLGPAVGIDALGTIVGLADFAAGDAETIAGLETPDAETLVVRLDRPTGGLGIQLSWMGTAPIPPTPAGDEPFGVAAGHNDDYEQFLVSTGPYMIEGSDTLDFTLPPHEQQPAAGYQPGVRLVLVRNPSWGAGHDDLRPARVDRMEIEIAGPDAAERFAAEVDAGTLDMVLQVSAPPQAPPEQVEAYRSDPELAKRLFVNEQNFIRFITMNVAMPPLDDVHVRRAINFAMDKAEIQELSGGSIIGRVAGHVGLNSATDNLLVDYDPFATPGRRGDVDKAREEMRLSRYDSDGDGVCDHDSCRGLRAVPFVVEPFTSHPDLFPQYLEPLGIDVAWEPYERDDLIAVIDDPEQKIAFVVGMGVATDLDPAGYFRAMFTADGVDSHFNYSMVGATAEQLTERGYSVTEVPNADERIEACLPEIGAEAATCWARVDQYLTQEVVPWVPYLYGAYVRTVSERVIPDSYSFDQSVGLPALDHLALQSER